MNQAEIERARKLAPLMAEAEAAAQTIARVSQKLTALGCDVVLTAWDWKRAGWTASIMPQGQISAQVKPIADRPQ